MGYTTADVLVERLIDWGVDTVFGLPGDAIMESLRTRQDRIRFVHVRHEEAAQALMRGEPNRDTIALTVLSDKVRELV